MINGISRIIAHWRDFRWSVASLLVAICGVVVGYKVGGLIGAIGGAILAPFVSLLLVGCDVLAETAPFNLAVEVAPPPPASGEDFPSYQASLIVRNKLSAKHLHGCTLYILEASNSLDQVQFPRFVEKFDLSPRAKRQVTFAYWTSREPPYADDTSIGIAGLVGGYDGNILRVAGSGSRLKIRVSDASSNAQHVYCAISVAQRHLCATLEEGDSKS